MTTVKFYLDTDTLTRDENTAHRVYVHRVLAKTPIEGSIAELVLLKNKLLQDELQSNLERASKTKDLRESEEYKKLRSAMFSESQRKNQGKIICEYCGRTCNRTHMDLHQATIDHIVPLSENGASLDRDNLVVACRSCNRDKRFFKGSFEEYKAYKTRKRLKER